MIWDQTDDAKKTKAREREGEKNKENKINSVLGKYYYGS